MTMNSNSSCSAGDPSEPIERSSWSASSSAIRRYDAYVTAARVIVAMVRAAGSVAGSDPDDQHGAVLVADRLPVVGDGAVPAEVIAGCELDLMFSLAQSPAAAQDEVVLIAGVGMGADLAARWPAHLEDRDVAGGPAVDVLHSAEAGPDDGPFDRADHARGWRVGHQEPGGGDVERVRELGQGVE